MPLGRRYPVPATVSIASAGPRLGNDCNIRQCSAEAERETALTPVLSPGTRAGVDISTGLCQGAHVLISPKRYHLRQSRAAQVNACYGIENEGNRIRK